MSEHPKWVFNGKEMTPDQTQMLREYDQRSAAQMVRVEPSPEQIKQMMAATNAVLDHMRKFDRNEAAKLIPQLVPVSPVVKASSIHSLRVSRRKHTRNLNEIGAYCRDPKNCLVCRDVSIFKRNSGRNSNETEREIGVVDNPSQGSLSPTPPLSPNPSNTPRIPTGYLPPTGAAVKKTKTAGSKPKKPKGEFVELSFRLAKECYDHHTEKLGHAPVWTFIGVAKLVESYLKRGAATEDELRAALLSMTGPITVNTLGVVLERKRGREPFGRLQNRSYQSSSGPKEDYDDFTTVAAS